MRTPYIMRKLFKFLAFILVNSLLGTLFFGAAPLKADINSSAFAARVSFATNFGPSSVETGDVDGDGKPDIVVTNYGSVAGIGNTVSVLRNTSTSGAVAFDAKVDLATPDGPHELAMGDLDGDGKTDLAVSNFGAFASGNTVSVFRNISTSGTIAFAPKVDFGTNKGPIGIVIGDVDGDGLRDLVVNQFNDGVGTLVSVLRNTSTIGNVSFTAKMDFTVAAGPYGVEMGDLDGDGKPELVVANNGSFAGDGNTASILRNTSTSGNVSFAAKVDVPTNNGPRGVAIGDIDGDSKPDVLISHFGGSGSGATVSALHNTSTVGNLSFAPKVDFTVGNGAIQVVIGDMDKDGKLDAAVANFGTTGAGAVIGNTTSVLRNTSTSGNISFAQKVDFITGNGPHDLAIGDIDGDSWLDLVSADYGSFSGDGNTVSVLRNLGSTSGTVTVPNVVGSIQAAAQQSITGAGLAVGIVTQTYNNTVPPGNVISQNPVAGASVASGSMVDLVVSLGPVPTSVSVPNVVGLTQAVAQTAITGAGLTVGTVTQENSNSMPAGSVISQNPVAGVSVAGGSAVDIAVSLGVAPVLVPNVVGLSQIDAETTIIGTGLTVGAISYAYHNSTPIGNVTNQNPIAGNSVAPGTAVNLVVSRGPAPGNPTISPSTFAAKVDFATNPGPTGVVIGDIDGNGIPDLAISNYGNAGNIGNTISILRNQSISGNVAFAPKVDFITDNGPHEITIGDLDGDGKYDLIVTNYGAFASGTTVSVYRNTSTNGNVTFASKVNFVTNKGPMGAALGDIDGDGRRDLAVANFDDGHGATVSLFRNISANGNVVFAPKVDFATGTGPHGVGIGDLDGDGKPELVVTNNGSLAGDGTTISVFRNTSTTGNVALAPKMDFTTGNGPRAVAIQDLDGDGKSDLLVANFGNANGTTVSALRNTSTSGNLAFALKIDFTVGIGALDVMVGDIDGDGKPDAVINNYGISGNGTTVSALRNTSVNGAITFASKVDFTVGAGPHGLAVGDIDGDSWLDVVTTNYGTGSVATTSVLRNTGGTLATVTVPAVVGLTQAAAQQTIMDVGLVVGTVTQAYDNNIPAGNVISQNPAAGVFVASSAAIDLVISLGPAPVTVTVPNLVGLTQAAAQQAITGAGLVVGIVSQAYDNGIPAGNVISQNPAAGASVASGAAVNLAISLGPAPVSVAVPNVVGSAQTTAQQTLTGAGLAVGIVTQVYDNSTPAGNVISQNPAAGAAVAPNRAVDLVVSRGAGTANGIDANAFAVKADFAATAGATGIVVGDLDGDGKPDLTAANYGSGSNSATVSVLRNTSASGTITFAPKLDLASNSGPYEIALGDLDGDSKLDLAVTHYGAGGSGNSVSVFRNSSTNGAIAFAPKLDFLVNPGPIGVAIGDVDGNGKPDLAVAQFNEGVGALVSVLRNTSVNGSISFAAKVDFAVGVGSVWVAIGDLDGDGKSDLAVTNNGSFAGSGNTVSILRNTSSVGNIAFAPKVDFLTNNGPRGVVIQDIDSDGKLDLAVANFGNGSSGNTVSVLRNTSTSGNLAFASKIDFAVGNGAHAAALRDINGDGKFDLIVTNFNSGNVSVLQNNSTSGSVSFAAKVDFATGPGAFDVGINDLDGDSWLDLVVTNYSASPSAAISILRNLSGTSAAVTVPNVVGLTQAAAQQAIMGAGLVVGTVTQVYDNSIPVGNVISQNPAAGAFVASGSAVDMVVSLGPASVSLTMAKAGNGSGTVTSSPGGINCGATCSANFTINTLVTLSAAASTGSTFTGWSGSGCAGTASCVVTVDAAKSVTANFTLNRYTLTITKLGSGTVTSTPAGIACGTTCSATYDYNTVVTLSASATAGWTFTGWSGDLSGTGASQNITINSNKVVIATFSDLIFADSFESGTLSAWSAAVTDAGNLSVNSAAALVGTQGMQAVINDNNSLYVTDNAPNAESRYRARFYFDPNSISMANNDAHYIFYGYAGTSTVVLRVEFRYSFPNYQLRAGLMNNAGSWQMSNWLTISNAPHFVEISWQAATLLSTANGYLTFWIDGVQSANLTGVANSLWRIDRARLGAIAGVDIGTRGTYYFDAFESRRQTYIGPASSVTAAEILIPQEGSQPLQPFDSQPIIYLPLVIKGNK